MVYANNCSDDSAQVARHAAVAAPVALRVVEVRLPQVQAHAGGARRAAMDLAEAWLRELSAFDGVILTTDADSQAARNWISANLNAFARGADAVLGHISLDDVVSPWVPAFAGMTSTDPIRTESALSNRTADFGAKLFLANTDNAPRPPFRVDVNRLCFA